jgi:hypothetical protein
MNALQSIQQWYRSQCNGDWEHSYGIKIDNIDNPGWAVKIDLRDTELEQADFDQVSYGGGDQSDVSGDDWLMCHRTAHEFEGCGGPTKLEEILCIFLKWAEEYQMPIKP